MDSKFMTVKKYIDQYDYFGNGAPGDEFDAVSRMISIKSSISLEIPLARAHFIRTKTRNSRIAFITEI